MLKSIVHNLQFILRRDLPSDLEALQDRLEKRADRYEQAIDERIERSFGNVQADLIQRTEHLAREVENERIRAEEQAESLSNRLSGHLSASLAGFDSRLSDAQRAAEERSSRYEQTVDHRIDERLSAFETAVGQRADSYEQTVDHRIDERLSAFETAAGQRTDSYEQTVDYRIDERLSAFETAAGQRADSHEQRLDHRIDEWQLSLLSEIDRRISEYTRAIDVRLDDRQVGNDRRIDNFFKSLEERVDARLETHERRIDRTLVQNRDDIIERTDLLLQIFDQRLDRMRTLQLDNGGKSGESFPAKSIKIHEQEASSVSQQIVEWSEKSTLELSTFSSDEQEIADYLLSFIDDPAGRGYVTQHLRRYLGTIHRIPPARRSGEKVLELGSLTPLAPAIRRYCGYQTIVGNNYWPGEEKVAEKVFQQTGGGERLAIMLHNFNVETDPFPFADGTFQVVLCGELLEHLHRDPLHMLWECNRVLEDNGFLILTTPNIAGCRSIEGVLTGCSPYLFSQYNLASPFDQHHREYAPREVRTALTAAGFEVLKLETEDVWRRSNPAILELLGNLGLSTDLRGDNIFAIAGKAGQPLERYPRELYID
ncbi:MAG: methyltransferase domain-containing protein [Acidobacteria bacterium]|nr:methyltransferase domain-containing protein [Acidobacteriota bacterium]